MERRAKPSSSATFAIASASIITEAAKDQLLTKITDWRIEDILSMLGSNLTTSRRQCAMVSLNALHEAVKKSRK